MGSINSCLRCAVPCINRKNNASGFRKESFGVKWLKDDTISFETLKEPDERSHNFDGPPEIQDEVNNGNRNSIASLESFETLSPNDVTSSNVFHRNLLQQWRDMLAKHLNIEKSGVSEEHSADHPREDEDSRQLKLAILYRRNPAIFDDAMATISNKK